MHLESDDGLPLGSHVVIGRAVPGARAARLRGGGHLEHHRLTESRGQDLHADGKAVVAGAERHAHGRVAGQVGRDGAHVVEVHGERVSGLGSQGERRGRRRRGQQDVEVRVGGFEVTDDQGANLLGLAVVGVVVPGRQGVGPEHDAPLDLGTETGAGCAGTYR